MVQSYGSLPHQPGVYQFLDDKGGILYVGKAKDLRSRVSSYFSQPQILTGKTKILVSKVKSIRIIIVESELESLLLEAALIKKYTPKYNIRLVDGKSYPLIRITMKSEYPAVVMARQTEDKKSLYFGPYPNAMSMRKVLRLLRKAFPYQSVLHHPKRYCLYHHLGLCPCPPMFTTDQQKQQYKKTLKRIIGFLEGRSKQIITDLEKERDAYAVNELFEKAKEIQQTLHAISQVTQPFVHPYEYVSNPHFREDLRKKETDSLQEILAKNNVFVGPLNRIECYDNSNIQGTNPTASMVVLTKGEIDKSQYRKFKVRTVLGPNDFATMQEILERRMKHTEWPYPDLVIVDGGKGQVSSAKKVLEIMHLTIPLIGLAKRDEIIITSSLEEIKLPKSSPALQLIMRIRDEAHRFAITFHRNLRSKNTFSNNTYRYDN